MSAGEVGDLDHDQIAARAEGAWLDLLVDPVDATHMRTGLLQMLPWVVVPVALAFRHFGRKDILS